MSHAIRHHWRSLSSLCLLAALSLGLLVWKPVAVSFFQETSRQAGFTLETLTVGGLQRTARNDVLSLLDMDAGMPLMAIDLTDVQEKIEALPWVRRATVTRVLPGEINIIVEERQPFALWQMQGELSLIDGDGVVITRSGLANFAELPIVAGPFKAADMQALFAMVQGAPALQGQIQSLVRVGERRWDIVFENGIRLKLPADRDPSYDSKHAWKEFLKLEQKHRLLAREVSVIDMRVKGRMIMRVTPAGRRMMDGKEWAT